MIIMSKRGHAMCRFVILFFRIAQPYIKKQETGTPFSIIHKNHLLRLLLKLYSPGILSANNKPIPHHPAPSPAKIISTAFSNLLITFLLLLTFYGKGPGNQYILPASSWQVTYVVVVNLLTVVGTWYLRVAVLLEPGFRFATASGINVVT